MDRSKTNRGGIFKTFMEPRNRFQGIDSASLCPSGPAQQPYSSRFLAPLDCSKVPAPCWYYKQSMGTWNQVGIGLLYRPTRARICKPFKEPGINSQPGGPVQQPYLLYQLARLHRLAESIPGLLKCLQIRAQATLASGIGSLEAIPGLLKRLKIRAQATLASKIGSLESIPRHYNMKNEDEDDFFVPQLSKGRIITNMFFHKQLKERRQTKVFVPQLSKELRRSEVFDPQLSKERRRSKVFVPQLSKERRRSEVFVPQLSMICHCYIFLWCWGSS